VSAPRGIGQSTVDQVQDKIDQVKDRVAGKTVLDSAVVKSYPTSTHAHTVEYRITSKEQLDTLYQNLSDSWRRGQAGKFKVE